MSSSRNMSNMQSNQKRNTFSRGGRGRGRGRGRRDNGRRRYNRELPKREMPKVEKKPKTKMELLRETDINAYTRLVQQKRIDDMSMKYADDSFGEKPKTVYIPKAFTKASGRQEADEVSRELHEQGWNFEEGEFIHPYTTLSKGNIKKLRVNCSDGVISVPLYDSVMDEQGVSSNIMNSDDVVDYFSENSYTTRVCPGSQTYSVEQYNFNDFWNSRRGKRTLKKYKYLEEREKRRKEYESRLKREEASNRAYEKAKREMRG